ncbi:MAG: hypothetical protein AB7E72_00565 [Lysobacterales bacterium]
MGRRISSNLILIAMISACMGAVAGAGEPDRGADMSAVAVTTSLPESAEGLAATLLLADSRPDLADSSAGLFAASSSTQGKSIAERALDDAAHSAGAVANELEMPFFSFGGSASTE